MDSSLGEGGLLSLAMRVAKAGAWEWAVKTNTVHWSDENFVLLGLDPKTCAASYDLWLRMVHPEDRERVQRCVEESLANPHQLLNCEFRITRGDGELRWIRDTGQVFLDDQGEVERMIGFQLDITEHKLVEEQLHEAQRFESIGRLAGGIAHDFNNLLTVFGLLGELLIRKSESPESIVACVKELQQTVDAGSALIRQLLAISGRATDEAVSIDLNQLIHSLEPLLRRLVREDIELELKLASGLGGIRVSWGHIEQVILNLVVNARDAMPSGGRLQIKTDTVVVTEAGREGGSLAPGRYVRMTVSDQGVGMDPETLAKAPDPFFSTKPATMGSGLGLSVVAGITKRYGAQLYLESQEGVGTQISVCFMEESSPTISRLPASPPPPLVSALNILLLEDDPTIRSTLATLLELDGHDVYAAASKAEALRHLEERSAPVDLLLSDVVLRDTNGFEFAAELRGRLGPELRVLFISGYTGEEDLPQATLEGHKAAFLPKPFSLDVLREKLALVFSSERPQSSGR